MEKAEGNLDDFFNTEGTTDPRRANEAIDRLAAARAELTKVVSQMSLKLRGVLTAQQWQELQRRGPGRGPGRFDGKIGPDGGPPGLRRFGSAGRPPNGQQSGQQKGPNPPPPPASQPSPPPAKPPAP